MFYFIKQDLVSLIEEVFTRWIAQRNKTRLIQLLWTIWLWWSPRQGVDFFARETLKVVKMARYSRCQWAGMPGLGSRLGIH